MGISNSEQSCCRLGGISPPPGFWHESPTPLEPVKPIKDNGSDTRVANDGASRSFDHGLLCVWHCRREGQHPIEAKIG